LNIGDAVIRKQNFGLARSISSFVRQPFDGLVGFGFDGLFKLGGLTLLSNMVKQKLITRRIFGVFIGRELDGTSGLSNVFIGDYDTSMVIGGMINFNPIVTGEQMWILKTNSIIVNGLPCVSQRHALIDTGTSGILMSVEDINHLKYYINRATVIEKQGLYWIAAPCDTKPNLSVDFTIILYFH